MTKLSSGMTRFHKRVFPIMWFGFLGVFFAIALVGGTFREAPFVLVVPVVMGVFGVFILRKVVWDLVDEVYDGGEYLLVRNRDDEERIPLTNIMNVSETSFMNPPRITLRLVSPGKFGDEVAFSPMKEFSLNPLAKSTVGEDLILRVHQARSKR